MESFIKEIEKNIDLFKIGDGNLSFFKFSDDVNKTFLKMLMDSNPSYKSNCEQINIDINKPATLAIKKDISGNLFLVLYGNDNRTMVIIRKDDSHIEDYKLVPGRKVIESEFISELDFIQKDKLQKSQISKRFLKDEIPVININEEMETQKILQYYRYLNDQYYNIIIDAESFDEPENENAQHVKKGGVAPERKNEVIDYELRKKELMKHNPTGIIVFRGNKTDITLEAYLYEREENTYVVVEPVSGIGYQYNLNLGPTTDKDIQKEMIKAALEAEESIILMDDAIIRKNHTTIETFSDSLDTLLNGERKIAKFYYDVKKSNSVYK